MPVYLRTFYYKKLVETRKKEHTEAEKAQKDEKFKNEIIPVILKEENNQEKEFKIDEHPRSGMKLEKLAYFYIIILFRFIF